MVKARRFLLIAALMSCGLRPLRAQMFGLPGQPFGAAPGQTSPETAEMQKAQSQLMREAVPELHAFQERLQSIEREIGRITERFAKDEINKESAKVDILPLIREAHEIRNDPEFLAEQRLSQAVFASPKFQKKAEAAMRALAEKQRRKRKARR